MAVIWRGAEGGWSWDVPWSVEQKACGPQVVLEGNHAARKGAAELEGRGEGVEVFLSVSPCHKSFSSLWSIFPCYESSLSSLQIVTLPFFPAQPRT